MINVDIDGLHDLEKALEDKAGEYLGELEAVVGEAAEGVRSEAQALVPVDTGTLHDSIGVEHDGLEAEVGVFDEEAYYGQYIEFGTTTRAANPFMGPAVEMERGRLEARLREAFK